MLSVFLVIACFSLARAAPSTGTCMCVTANNVNCTDAAGLSSHVITSMSKGECYIFNGGILTKDGYTWYELQHVHGHNRAWAASNYLHRSSSSMCRDGSSLERKSRSSYASGLVSQACLHCMCLQASGCSPIGCIFDVNSDSCGYFLIQEYYWQDCGRLGSSWKACASDLYCASLCVQNYMKRYASRYGCPMTCEGFAREHFGGPNGCHRSSTIGYWNYVQSNPGCSNV